MTVIVTNTLSAMLIFSLIAFAGVIVTVVILVKRNKNR